MKTMKSLLLGTATGLVAIAGAQAADLPVKAKPVEYVKVCTAYGAGFYYIPGTDICLRVGGYIFAELGWNGRSAGPLGWSGNIGTDLVINRDDNLFNLRAQAMIILDARQQSQYGTIRSYLRLGAAYQNALGGAQYVAPAAAVGLEAAFIQFAGFTVGQTTSFWDFGGFYSVLALGSIPWNWNPVFAYTANFGNGVSATISLEDASAYRTKVVTTLGPVHTGSATTTNYYGGTVAPDIIGNIRVDQAWGSAQIAGALHHIRINEAGAALIPGFAGDTWGWAVMGGIEIKTPMVAPGDSIMLQGVYSKGAVEYTGISASPVTTASGLGLRSGSVVATATGPSIDLWDAALSCIGGVGVGSCLTTAWSWNLMFRHFWQPNLRSAFWVGQNRVEHAPNVPPISPNLNMYQAGANIIWSPNQTLDLSLDLLWTRMETDGTNLDKCIGLAAGVSCGATADIFTVWSRWRRNF